MPNPNKEDNQAVKSGSVVADNSKEDYRTPKDESAKDQETPDKKETSENPTGSPEDKGDAFSEKLSKQLEDLNNSIRSMSQGSGEGAESQESSRDYDQELLELQEKANDGDISYSELIAQSQAIQDAKTQEMVASAIDQYEQRRQVSGIHDQFLSQNPDFSDFVNSDANRIMQEANPMLDNLSSYYASRADQIAEENLALKQELADLKGQVQTSVKGAAASQSSRVGAESGTDLRRRAQQSNENLSPKEGMLAALLAQRQQQA